MKTHRVCTTISTKHWELLKKHTEKYGTQQKVLEWALEALEKDQNQDVLSPEEHFWVRLGTEFKMCIVIHKEIFFELARTADFERITGAIKRLNLLEYQLVYYYQKPLKECSLKEVMDGIVITCKTGNWFDTVNYTDDGNYYTLRITHSIGSSSYTRTIPYFFEGLFKQYGVDTQSEMSESSLFMKVFKK